MTQRRTGIDRRQLLQGMLAGTGLSMLPMPAGATTGGAPHRMLLVMVEGGWDVSYCMDPKVGLDTVDGPEIDEDPDNPDDVEAVQTFADIPILVNPVKRPAVGEFFGRHASDVAVVNGIWVGAIAHATARVRILNGTPLEKDPSWATIIGSIHGETLPLGSVDLSGGSYMGPLAATAGQIGIQSQLKALVEPSADFPPLPSRPGAGGYRLDEADQDLLLAHLRARNAAVASAVSDRPADAKLFADRDEALTRSSRFRTEGRDTIAGLTLGVTPSFSTQLDLAMDLLEGDLCRTVTVDSGPLWDSHRDNVAQHGHFQSLFSDLTDLVPALKARGLWDTTLVVVVSEMTRTPKFNSTLGKDHWPHTSAMLFGRNVVGGQVYGGSDNRLESLPIDPVTGMPDPKGRLNKYDNFAAGLLASLDIDPAPWYPTIDPYLACFG